MKVNENLKMALVIVAVLVVAVVLLNMASPSSMVQLAKWGEWLVEALKVLILIILGIVVALIALCITGVAGFFGPMFVDWLDEQFGNDEVNGFLKFLLVAVIGMVVAVGYVMLLSAATYIPFAATIYSFIGDVQVLHEAPLAVWGWPLWGFIAYAFGWMGYAMNKSS